MKNKRLLIGGPVYGLHNIGDEALLLSILRTFKNYQLRLLSYDSNWLKEEFPSIEIIKIPTMYTKPKFHLTATPRKQIFHSIRWTFFPDLTLFDNVDCFICGGGTILSECPWHVLHLIELAKKKNVPTILWGVGMATISDETTKEYLRDVLNSSTVKKIYTRDNLVMDRLIDYGIDSSKIDYCYDPAYKLLPCDFSIGEYLNTIGFQNFCSDAKKICISLAGEKDVTNTKHISIIRETINRLIEYGYSIFLVPTGCGAHCKDIEFLRTLVTNESVVLIDRELKPEELVYFLSKMDLIISSRLHCSILGSISGVPSICLARSTKNIDFAKIFNLPFYRLDELNENELIDTIVKLIDNKNHYSNEIRKMIESIIDRYDLLSKDAIHFIESI